MSGSNARARRRFLVGAAVLVFFAPGAVLSAAFGLHAVGYRGTCGPYAPDISEFPCDFATYSANFLSPFAIGAFLILIPLVWMASFVMALCAWVLFEAWLRARSPR